MYIHDLILDSKNLSKTVARIEEGIPKTRDTNFTQSE